MHSNKTIKALLTHNVIKLSKNHSKEERFPIVVKNIGGLFF